MKHAAVILAFLASSSQAQFKCVGSDGSVSFQQQPCAAGAKAERLALPTPAPIVERPRLVQLGLANNVVVAGMNLTEVRRVMKADPDRVNTSWVSRRLHEQMVYDLPRGTVYVYTEDGIVTSVQVSRR